MQGAFLDASVLRNKEYEEVIRIDVQQNRIRFEFPEGYNQLRLIEECRAINALDVSDPDNFDLMYDMTVQMLVGKPVFIYYIDEDKKTEIARFVITNRYMNLRNIDIIDEYPVLVNWLVEFMAGMLGKKFPRSLKSIQAIMSERSEHTKSLKEEEKVKITTSR
jgi:hypothetical protein